MTLGHLLRGIIALQACLFLFFLISGSKANDHVMVRRHLEKKEFYKRQYAYDGDVPVSYKHLRAQDNSLDQVCRLHL